MLLPWRVATAEDRKRLQAAFGIFRGQIMVPGNDGPGVSTRPASSGPAPEDALARLDLPRRIETEADDRRDIWIAAGRVENPLSLFSLLHARVQPGNEADVDLLLTADIAGAVTPTGYVGFGELLLLAVTLEEMRVKRFRIPVHIDVAATGLEESSWTEQSPGVYVDVRPTTPALDDGHPPGLSEPTPSSGG